VCSRFARLVGLILCLAFLGNILPGCGPAYPPDDRVVVPQVAGDSQGNVIVLYQVNTGGRGPVTYVQKLGPDGRRMWGKEGLRLDEREPNYPECLNVDAMSTTEMVVASMDDSTTVFWTYRGAIYAESLDGEGRPRWKPQRLVVGTFDAPGGAHTRWGVTANATGTTIVWTDEKRNLNFQAVDADGNLRWTTPRLDTNAYEFEAHRGSDGNTWILWADMDRRVYLQMVDSTGNARWTEATVLQQTARSWSDCALWVAEDKSEGVIAAWQYGDDTPVEIRSVTPDGVVRVSAIDQFFKQDVGARLCGPLVDQSDGVVALWSAGSSVVAQRVDPQGATKWGERGLVVADDVVTPDAGNAQFQASAHPGGTLVSWSVETDDGLAWRAQWIDAQGKLLWPNGGVSIGTTPGKNSAAWQWRWSATERDGAVILSGVATESTARGSSLQRVNADGGLPWGMNGVRLDDW
jgi:hypothetical protein